MCRDFPQCYNVWMSAKERAIRSSESIINKTSEQRWLYRMLLHKRHMVIDSSPYGST